MVIVVVQVLLQPPLDEPKLPQRIHAPDGDKVLELKIF